MHEWRHSMRSLSMAAGVDVLTLATIAGHSDAALIWSRYGHPMPGATQAAADRMNAAQRG